MTDDPRLSEAKVIPVEQVLARFGVVGLRRQSGELIGPCPLCGSTGHSPKSGPVDRFGINLNSHAFLCRKCDFRGGDNIALVMGLQSCDFKDALQFLCGDRPANLDPKEMARRVSAAKIAEEKQRRENERFRKWAIDDARGIWKASRPGQMGVVRAYLTARGLGEDVLPQMPDDLNFIVAHPYIKKINGTKETPHTGPCMIAAVRASNGNVMAVHQTWVDPEPPHGKATIVHCGNKQPAKLVRGSKKGGAIRLWTPERFDTLVMGEGIETTLTALAGWSGKLDVSRTAFWAGVDLGNMSGRMIKIPGIRHSGKPDPEDYEAFVPPAATKRLIFIQDGDSAAKATRAKLLSGLRRAMHRIPGLQGQIVHAGDGVDLNDVLTTGGDDERK